MPAVRTLRDTQLEHLRKTVVSILMLGVNQGKIQEKNILQIADHFIVTIDGLGVFALGNALSEDIIDNQFQILYDMVCSL